MVNLGSEFYLKILKVYYFVVIIVLLAVIFRQFNERLQREKSRAKFILYLFSIKVFNLSLLEGNCPNKRHIKALRVAPGHSCLKTEFQFAPSVHFKFTKFSNYIQSMIV